MMIKGPALIVYLVNLQILQMVLALEAHCQKNHWIWHFDIWYVLLALSVVNSYSFSVQLINFEV
jgi:hypothetical protein